MRQYINLFEQKEVTFGSLLNISDEAKGKGITSLKGMPEDIESIDLSNNQLTTLEYSPKKIRGYMDLDNNPLISLKGGPKFVDGFFSIRGCEQLASLEGAPEVILGSFDMDYSGITSLKGFPKFVGHNVYMEHCPNLTPWEMRYMLFSVVPGKIYTKSNEVKSLLHKYFLLNDEQRKDVITDVLSDLRKLS